MRAAFVTTLVLAGLVPSAAWAARGQPSPPPASTTAASTTSGSAAALPTEEAPKDSGPAVAPLPPSTVAPAPAASPATPPVAAATSTPPPAGTPPTSVSPAQLTGTPNPSALAPSAADDWRFSIHGYFRAPLRLGMGRRPVCSDGAAAGTVEGGVPCAGPGQSTVNFHTPYLPDDQYLDWRYNRQWERDWTEVFLNFGNSTIVGTVGLQAFNLTDASFNNTSAQFGISQAYVTIRPTLPVPGLRLEWKVGSFWNRYGGAGKYDAGKYDTYLFGRTHSMGETLAAEMDMGDVTFKAAHGFGAKLEQGQSFPPGLSLLNHLHGGLTYKKRVDLNAHYLASWTQDARATPTIPDGFMSVAGVEARVTGGVYGEVYLGYSHVGAEHVQAVGPAIEVIHSFGGGGVGGAQGLIENYLGPCATCAPEDVGTGSIDTVALQYDYSFGTLYRKLTTGEGFWGDGSDVTLSLFGMYNRVSSKDPTTDGTSKVKYGADLIYSALHWFAVGARYDHLLPTSRDSSQSFWVISPKVMFRSRFLTHEEVTLQYSRYTYGAGVKPQSPNDGAPPDQNVFGIKVTMWW